MIHKLDNPVFMTSLLGMGMDARFRGQSDEAKEYFSEALKIARLIRSPLFIAMMESELAHADRMEYEPVVAGLKNALGTEEFQSAWSQGRNMNMDRAIQYAISVEPQAV